MESMLLFFSKRYVQIAKGSKRIAARILPLVSLGRINASRRTASEDVVMQ